MILFLVFLLIAATCSALGWGPAPFRIAVGTLATFLFPGGALLLAASAPGTPSTLFLRGPLLSPLLLGLGVTGALWSGIDPVRMSHSLVLGSGIVFLVLLFRSPPTDGELDEEPPRLAWLLGAVFAGLIALVLADSAWRRITSDSWFHAAVVAEIERAGVPPEDPYFAGLPLQYFWFFHAVLLGLRVTTGLAPPESMALLNIAAVFLCLPIASRIAAALGLSTTSGVWGGVVLLLGMGGLSWLFLPFKLMTAFVGDVRGSAEVREILNLTPFTPARSELFTQVLNSSDFFLRKFLVGTAVSWCFALVLLAADSALRLLRFGRPTDGFVLLMAAGGAFLFHVIVGGASAAALALGALLAFLTRRAPPVATLIALVIVVLGIVAGLPYLRVVTAAKEADNLFPLGVSLRAWASLPVTLLGVGLLAFPFIRGRWRTAHGSLALHFGWLAAALLYALFARLPGPNQFDKPPLVVYLPLALTAGFAIPDLWESWKGRPWRRALFAAGLVLFLLPENALRYASYLAEAPAPAPDDREAALYDWIGTQTPRDAVFLDSGDRVDVLLRGPRAQYWGKEAYADQWGYPVQEVNRRRALRDAVYSSSSLDRTTLAPLAGLERPVYVVVREAEVPGVTERLAARRDLFASAFQTPGYRVFRVLLRP